MMTIDEGLLRLAKRDDRAATIVKLRHGMWNDVGKCTFIDIGCMFGIGAAHASTVYQRALFSLCDDMDVSPRTLRMMLQPKDGKHTQSIGRAVATLTDREREVVKLRYGIGYVRSHTLKETGDVFGICKERLRQIQCKAERKLSRGVIGWDVEPRELETALTIAAGRG